VKSTEDPLGNVPLFTPDAQRISSTRFAAFRSFVGRDADTYMQLHDWSVAAPDEFWSAVWKFCGVVGDPGDVSFERDETGIGMRADRFFPEASLNVVDTFLANSGTGEAIVALDELGRRQSLSWDELRSEVGAVAAALRSEGVEVDDRVVAWLPNGVHAVVTMLAAASLGAVYSSTSPDFGVEGVVDRFEQIEPKVLIAADGYHYGGKPFDCLERLQTIVTSLPSVRRVVIVDHLHDAEKVRAHRYFDPSWTLWNDWKASHAGALLTTVPLPFDHPWYVLFSSGTTGKPKCIVHRAGGVLLKHLEEQQLQTDVRVGDRIFYFTTTGWMMWNWLVSALASGANAILYDGSPFYPDGNVLFSLADSERATLFGVSAKFLDACAKADLQPKNSHDLSSVRTICSTGSPLSPEGFRYVYDKIKSSVHLASISGGTDLCGCFVGGDPTGSVFAGEIQRPMLGMAVAVYSDGGQSLGSDGGAGELVCTRSFPSMPLGFWNDPNGSRYAAAYFTKFDGLWAHGDFASWTAHGGMIVHGRSDTTLNPGGVRIGTAEIYRAVEQIPSIVESLVFGQAWDNDTRIVLLVRLANGAELNDAMRADIRARVRTACTPRHVPAVIAAVADLPRTRSGKLVELAVADVVHGRAIRNTEAIANIEALHAIAELPELR
jgi:acetoacetyl-CoA synthetase